MCFTNTSTKPPASGYEVEVVKHTLPLCYGSSHYIEKEEVHSPHFAILTAWSFEWWGSIFFAFLNKNLMKLTQTHLYSVYVSGKDEV